MARQAERREATRGAILKAARSLFGEQGFADTSMDEIAAAAGVAKGAVYHHFPTKEALFEAVSEAAASELADRLAPVARAAPDPLAGIAEGTHAYFRACAEGPLGRIVLIDGPAVLGWERWRRIDEAHFGRTIPQALAAAMRAGLIAEQPVEPLARLLLGAMTEAAIAAGAAQDPAGAGRGYAEALTRLLDGLRLA